MDPITLLDTLERERARRLEDAMRRRDAARAARSASRTAGHLPFRPPRVRSQSLPAQPASRPGR